MVVNKMKIAICDDDEYCLSKLKELMSKCYIEAKKCDVIVLDIEMKELSGLDVAKQIRNLDNTVIIAFLTSHQEFTTLGYEVNAYIV